jgi:hypothetical protein
VVGPSHGLDRRKTEVQSAIDAAERDEMSEVGISH